MATAGLLVFVVGVACGDALQRDIACLHSEKCINQRDDWREKATELCAEAIGVSQPVELGQAWGSGGSGHRMTSTIGDIRRVHYQIVSPADYLYGLCPYYPLDEVVGDWR